MTKILSKNIKDKTFFHPECEDSIGLTWDIWKYVKSEMYSFERTVAYIESLLSVDAIKFEEVYDKMPEEFGGEEVYNSSYIKIKTIK